MPELKFDLRGSAYTSVILIDSHTDTIHFYTKSGGQFRHDQANCRLRQFDQEYFDRFGKIVTLFKQKNPGADLQKSMIILPDYLFLMDTVKIPVIHRRAMSHSLSLAVESMYKNASELNITTIGIQQNRQYATYGLIGVRQDLLALLRQACSQIGVGVAGVTFAANATANGALAANSKLKNGTFLLLDIKEDYAQFAFVVKGNTMGYYDLPFGYNALYRSRLAAEDLLFDHDAADLLVLNAKEKARAKQLTMGSDGMASAQHDGSFQDDDENPEQPEASITFDTVGSGKKTARRLPKFMLRPTPQSREEYVYENFRIFMKWALDLIRGNGDIVDTNDGLTVYVNMPAEYRYLFNMVNTEDNGQNVVFSPLLAENADENICASLELYGGLYSNLYNKQNTF